MSATIPDTPNNFIKHIVSDYSKDGNSPNTRFPPEPNGYLHIGHAKSICLNFGVAKEFGGACNLRFDDTNPEKERVQFMRAISADVRWLGFTPAAVYHASDYFAQLYDYACTLIKQGNAYVDSLSAEQIRQYRGTLTEAGKESPDRSRTIADNLALFAAMRNGDFADGQYVLRAKIDMAAGNINMRDPTLYRIRRIAHQQTGEQWCIYPMYDFTHCLSDAIEGISHSLCTLEFEDHRPLYDWVLDKLNTASHPSQIEFARLQLEYTVLSKRKLALLVDGGKVSGWDDPRMPTLAGMRNAGYTPAAIRDFCERIGVSKKDSCIKLPVLENCIREDLNDKAPRAMAVLHPIKVSIENYSGEETLTVANHPQSPQMGERQLIFGNTLWIEAADFALVPPPKFKRLVEGGEVRLRGAYVIKCHRVIQDTAGIVVELKCTYDADTLGKKPEGRKVKGVIHWVGDNAIDAEIRLYDKLFTVANPEAQDDFFATLNDNSMTVLHGCKVEAGLANSAVGSSFQFERVGYFCLAQAGKDGLVFNRTVTMREGW